MSIPALHPASPGAAPAAHVDATPRPAPRGSAPANAATAANPATAAPAAPAARGDAGQAADAGALDAAVNHINKALQTLSPSLEFSIDDDSDRTIVKIVDQQTREVIRQIPTAEALDISKALDKVQGLLIRQAV